MDETIAAKLRAPFEPKQIGHLPKITCPNCSSKDRKCEKHELRKCRTCNAYVSTQHIHIDYVGHADTTDRLLAVDPGWNWEPLGFSGDGLPAMDGNGGMWIKLTVAGVTRLGYGHAGQKRGGDAVKEIIGDAIRNAAMRFGVALDLWRKESPEPVAAAPRDDDGPDEAVTTEQVINGLRQKCLAIWRGKGGDITSLVAEYARWSSNAKDQQGRDLAKETDVAILREFEKFLRSSQAKP
jgi:hypothetical protein